MTDISDRVVENFHAMKLDALICIGGDGSLRLAQKFIAKGIPIVAVPKTIDNDISGTVVTFGHDTAVSTATDAIGKLHSTAESHERVMVVELMGRYAGWIALARVGADLEVGFPDSVGVGSYRIDLHPTTRQRTYVDISSWPISEFQRLLRDELGIPLAWPDPRATAR